MQRDVDLKTAKDEGSATNYLCYIRVVLTGVMLVAN